MNVIFCTKCLFKYYNECSTRWYVHIRNITNFNISFYSYAFLFRLSSDQLSAIHQSISTQPIKHPLSARFIVWSFSPVVLQKCLTQKSLLPDFWRLIRCIVMKSDYRLFPSGLFEKIASALQNWWECRKKTRDSERNWLIINGSQIDSTVLSLGTFTIHCCFT